MRRNTPFWFHTEQGLRQSTTAEIVAEGQRLGGGIRRHRHWSGDVVALQLPTRFETAILYVAALHAGATLLPIVHIYGPEETGFILRTARARALVIPDRWRNIDYLERLSALGATPDLEHVIVVGERATRGARLFSDFEQLATTTLPACESVCRRCRAPVVHIGHDWRTEGRTAVAQHDRVRVVHSVLSAAWDRS